MNTIKLEFQPPATIITLNRPEVRNAISPEMIEEFEQALTEIAGRKDIAAVVVTGKGKSFCSGADLAALKNSTELPADRSLEDAIRLKNFFRSVYNFSKPVIAAVNGAAMGGGCGLASVCDLVVAGENARFGYTELKVGLVPALVSVFLVRICGEKKARELLYSGRVFSAEEARAIGLVNEVVAPERLLDRSLEIAGEIAQNSPVCVRLTKQLINEIQSLSFEEGLVHAVHYNVLIRTTDDFKEGVTAYLEKRPPSWTGF